jgi:hypothetical protein
VRILVVNTLALLGALVALTPLLFRRQPRGHRMLHLPRRTARVIPFERRRDVRRTC